MRDSSRLGWDDGSRRVRSLLDVMNLFNAGAISWYINHFADLECEIENPFKHKVAIATGGVTLGGTPRSELAVRVRKPVIDALNECRRSGLGGAVQILERISVHLSDWSIQDQAVKTHVTHAREAILADLKKTKFLSISAGRADFVDNPKVLGDAVLKAFPKAGPDIAEAGNCLAAECNTAAVFHLMRVVEWGLRALCVHLGFRKAKNKFKKSGAISYVPIEYSEWEKMLDQLNVKVDAKMTKLGKGKIKQAHQEFYYPALQDIRGIRDAWRNHVMHSRSEYNRSDADAVLSHVRRIMTVLATRVKEV